MSEGYSQFPLFNLILDISKHAPYQDALGTWLIDVFLPGGQGVAHFASPKQDVVE